MRTELKRILDSLLQASGDESLIALDDLGEAVGDIAVSHAEIEALIDALESAGKRVDTRESGSAVVNLKSVLSAARELKARGGGAPTVAAIAARSGLSTQAVSQALALARVMQR